MQNKIQSIYNVLNQFINWTEVAANCGITNKTVYRYISGDHKTKRTAELIANTAIKVLTQKTNAQLEALENIKNIAMSAGADWPDV